MYYTDEASSGFIPTTILTPVRFSFSQNTEISQHQKKQKTLTKQTPIWQW